jgi:hypothetical protein
VDRGVFFGVFVLLGWEDGVGGELLFGALDWECAPCFFVGGEVGAGYLEVLDQEGGSLEVDVVAGETGGGVGESALDGGAVVQVGDVEGIVLEDGGDVVGTVLETHDLVVHGGGAAADAVFFRVLHALALAGRFALVVLVDRHVASYPPRGGYIPKCFVC